MTLRIDYYTVLHLLRDLWLRCHPGAFAAVNYHKEEFYLGYRVVPSPGALSYESVYTMRDTERPVVFRVAHPHIASNKAGSSSIAQREQSPQDNTEHGRRAGTSATSDCTPPPLPIGQTGVSRGPAKTIF